MHLFADVGSHVAVDRPFAGALVPMRVYRTDTRVRAIMVELRRGLYVDEQSGVRLGSTRSLMSGT